MTPRFHIHLDPLGGIAGDMFAAALLDSFPDLIAPVQGAIDALGLPDKPQIAVAKGRSHALTGSRLSVDPPEATPAGHAHTHWSDIRAIIEAAPLAEGTRTHALGIFGRLAEAEARMHGVDVEKVAFHELGALDSIVDIVAAAALIDLVSPSLWSVGPLPRCRGQINTAHGVLPLPAPATALLLEGFELADDGEIGERVTPTGAAILAWLAPEQGAQGQGKLLTSGAGLGTKELKTRANLLRCLVFEPALAEQPDDAVTELRFEIDDQTAEDLAIALDHLRTAPGVLDVVQWPVFAKKGRVSTAVQVLTQADAADEVAAAVFRETTTLGLRSYRTGRHILRRQMADTAAGKVKIAERPDGGATAKLDARHVAGVPGAAERARLRQAAEAEALAGRDGDD